LAQTIDSIRLQTRRLSTQLNQSAEACSALLNLLPEVPQPILTLQQAPTEAAKLSMALAQTGEELSELSLILEKAVNSSAEMFVEEHRKLLLAMEAAERTFTGTGHA
jgi:hypothetical protein